MTATYAAGIGYEMLSVKELSEFLRSPFVDEQVAATDGVHAIVTRVGADDGHDVHDVPSPGALPVVLIGVVAAGDERFWRHDATPFDVVIDAGGDVLDLLLAQIDRHPIAACSLAVLLRGGSSRTVEDGLAAESAVYSTLQGGPEFAAWRTTATHAPSGDDRPPVRVQRRGSVLELALDRPHRHNAFDAATRDALAEALGVASLDPEVARIELRGVGPSFCSGGDLGEFGTRADPASAHIVRLSRSVARLIHRLADITHVYLHGACYGAGIELPAFAGHVVAHPDTAIALPEIDLGLIPGAGGTVSLPRRIGRHRTARIALSGERIDAATALEWGLVDEIAHDA